MKRKLSKKEYNEVVTKGYFLEVLDSHVTKEYLDKKLENYVTKDHLEERLTAFTETIMGEFRSQIKMVIEYLQTVIERYDREHREFDSKISGQEKWLHRHEYRIGKLEGEQS